MVERHLPVEIVTTFMGNSPQLESDFSVNLKPAFIVEN